MLLALSFGQRLGTLSFVLYLVTVARDLGIARRLRLAKKDDVGKG